MSRHRTRRRRRRYDMRKVFLLIFVLGSISVLAGYGIRTLTSNPVVEEVKLEAGDTVTVQQFLEEQAEGAAFITDVSKVNTWKPGTYDVKIKVKKREFSAKLVVEDTTAPTAEAVEVVTDKGVLPEAMDCVKNIVDATNVTATYKTKPDVSKNGTATGVVLLMDEAGNKTDIPVTIKVWSDEEAPVIAGTSDKVVTEGGTVSYRKDVTVTDNFDENPKLDIDSSAVDLNKPGTYTVVYTATDAAGNVATKSITVTVVKKQQNEVEIDETTVNALAQKVLDKITNESMSDMEVAFAIYKWVNRNISYVNTSDKSSWLIGAHQAFTKKSGDCFNYFAAAKALFNAAGIENVDVVKSDTSHSRHYWSLINLGDGWYHVDCTPRKGEGDLFFMVTDAELEAYSKAHSNSHIFEPTAYPERATESVQDKVDYAGGKIKE